MTLPHTLMQAAATDRTDRKRACSKRKSYTVDFKLETFKLLEYLSQLKTKKWEKVAEKQGIIKSLVVKWNNREKIKTKVHQAKGKLGQLERFKKTGENQ